MNITTFSTFLALMIALSSVCHSQAGPGPDKTASNNRIIPISVLDRDTHKPVPWASVFSRRTGYGLIADSLGQCSFSEEIDPEDSFVVSAIGYTQTVISGSELRSGKNIVYLKMQVYESAPVVISTIPELSGFELLNNFRTRYKLNYPQHPLTGKIYVHINSTQNAKPVRDAEYVSAFYCKGYVMPFTSMDTLFRQRLMMAPIEGQTILNPTTANIIAREFWLPFQKIDVLPYLLNLNKRNTEIRSVRKFQFNGTPVYHLKLSLKEPLIYSDRVSRVLLDMYLSGIDFSVFKYRISYAIYFDNTSGSSKSINIKGNHLNFSTPAGFLYDSIISSKEVYFKKEQNFYIPFYSLTSYKVYDREIAKSQVGFFDECREYFIYKISDASGLHRRSLDELLFLIADEEPDDLRFWQKFIRPDKEILQEFLAQEDDED
jgi:hypothetical protein